MVIQQLSQFERHIYINKKLSNIIQEECLDISALPKLFLSQNNKSFCLYISATFPHQQTHAIKVETFGLPMLHYEKEKYCCSRQTERYGAPT